MYLTPFKKILILIGFLGFIGCDNNRGDTLGPDYGLANGDVQGPIKGKVEHPFLQVAEEPFSTFSVDVDTASYTHTRGSIIQGQLPAINKIRTEEFINYFDYPLTEPKTIENPLAVSFEVGEAPWANEHRLLKAIIKAKEIPRDNIPPLNLVFLIDVSGSMYGEGRLNLSKYALNFIVDSLRKEDRLSIVTYSSGVEIALRGASGEEKEKIRSSIRNLTAAGGTTGHAGIQTAYQIAKENYIPEGFNRVILSTDGDFNIGISDTDSLVNYIKTWSDSNIFLTVHGYGMGNFNDDMLEKLTNKGNGNYAYIDSRAEAKRVFEQQLIQTVSIVARDAKIQLQFDEDEVEAYRLIGYENRLLDNSDFENDSVDAGDVGSGHVVVALYELKMKTESNFSTGMNIGTLKLRYKSFPDFEGTQEYQTPLIDRGEQSPSTDHCFATLVAGLALKIARSQYIGDLTYSKLNQLGESCDINDKQSKRKEFLEILSKASELSSQS